MAYCEKSFLDDNEYWEAFEAWYFDTTVRIVVKCVSEIVDNLLKYDSL